MDPVVSGLRSPVRQLLAVLKDISWALLPVDEPTLHVLNGVDILPAILGSCFIGNCLGMVRWRLEACD